MDHYAIVNRKRETVGQEKVTEYLDLQAVAKGEVEKGVEEEAVSKYGGEASPEAVYESAIERGLSDAEARQEASIVEVPEAPVLPDDDDDEDDDEDGDA